MYYKLFRLEDLFECGKLTDEFHSSGTMVSASEYDMLLHVTVDSRLKSDRWVVGARAYGDIVTAAS